MPEPTDINERRRPVKFTIDGRPFTTENPQQRASALLRLAGLDPEAYDLAQLRPGHPTPKRYEENEVVHIKDGEKFVTIRESAEVA